MNIKDKREKAQLTQAQLAKELGVDQSAVCLWETGRTSPRAKLLPRIARLLSCTVDELVIDEIGNDAEAPSEGICV